MSTTYGPPSASATSFERGTTSAIQQHRHLALALRLGAVRNRRGHHSASRMERCRQRRSLWALPFSLCARSSTARCSVGQLGRTAFATIVDSVLHRCTHITRSTASLRRTTGRERQVSSVCLQLVCAAWRLSGVEWQQTTPRVAVVPWSLSAASFPSLPQLPAAPSVRLLFALLTASYEWLTRSSKSLPSALSL